MIYIVSYTIVYVFDIHCTQLIVKTQKSFAGCPGRESFPSWRRWQLKPLPLPAEIQRFIMFATKKLLSFGGVSRICFINPCSNLWVSQRLWWGRCGWNCQKKCQNSMVNHGIVANVLKHGFCPCFSMIQVIQTCLFKLCLLHSAKKMR